MTLKPLNDEQLEARWSELARYLDQGAAQLCTAIAAEPDDASRNQLFRFAVRKLGGGTGATTAALDAMIVVGDATIASALATAARRPDEAALWTEEANISAYNLSANLCDCWGDGDSRTQAHFAKGLEYAQQALALREKLGKGPRPFAMAHWACGKHLLSLRRYDEAAAAFDAALAHTPDDPLCTALAGLARMRAVTAALRADGGEDAMAYVAQIEESERRC